MTNSPQFHLIESYSNEFQAQLRRINAFVKHPSAIGTAHEGILRRFLQRYVPKKFTVGEGFILDIDNNPSGQCDIIIWNHLDYVPYYADGDFVIIPADAAKVVIEVKTRLGKDTLVDAFQNLNSVKMVGQHIYTALFAFESTKLRNLIEQLAANIQIDLAQAVNSIYAMQGWLLQMSRDIPFGSNTGAVPMETRQDHLLKFSDPLALSIILPPHEKALAHGLTEFLAHIYMTLDLQDMEIPFHAVSGPYHRGYLFPGRGFQLFNDTLEERSADPRDGLLQGRILEDFLTGIDSHMQTISQNHKDL